MYPGIAGGNINGAAAVGTSGCAPLVAASCEPVRAFFPPFENKKKIIQN